MWDGLLTLLMLSAVMGITSFISGSLPLSFTLTKRQLNLISALGTGVLIGVALIVIIPEGVEALYDASSSSPHTKRADSSPSHPHDQPHVDPNPQEQTTERDTEPHAWVGLTLILGFMLMYLIDVLPKHPKPSSGPPRPLHISLNALSRGPHREDQSPTSSPPLGPVGGDGGANDQSIRDARSVTIGLVIHSISDGIALGASTTTDDSSQLGFVVFLALMIHKAPAAFGLTSVLLKKGLGRQAARAHLAIFSIAAPAGALGTWLLVHLLGTGWLTAGRSEEFGTGLLLLFSGGTFLYVAAHSLIPSSSSAVHGPSYHSLENGYGGSQRQSEESEPRTIADTGATVIGMLLPLLMQVNHAH